MVNDAAVEVMRESGEEGDGDGEDGERGFDASFSGHFFPLVICSFPRCYVIHVNVNVNVNRVGL